MKSAAGPREKNERSGEVMDRLDELVRLKLAGGVPPCEEEAEEDHGGDPKEGDIGSDRRLARWGIGEFARTGQRWRLPPRGAVRSVRSAGAAGGRVLEGIVSKRKGSPYISGPTTSWRKVKCPDYKREGEGT